MVKPYFPPRVEDGIVFACGSCDDKGSVVSTIVALRILGDVLSRFGKSLSRDVIGMFVVEEETGGNGSLSLALDKSLSDLYSSLLVWNVAEMTYICESRSLVPGSLGGA